MKINNNCNIAPKKYFRPVYFPIIFFLFAFNYTFGQHGILKGTVKDGESALQSATVSLGKQTTLANSNGDFYFSAAVGTYTLIITHTGYQRIVRPVTIVAGETQSIQFIMTKDEVIENTVVLASRSSIHRSNLNTAVPVDVVNARGLSKTQFIDPKLLLFATVPSFNSPPQVTGQAAYLEPATLRGMGPDQLLVLVNGKRRHTMASVFQFNTIGRGTSGTDINSIPRSAIKNIEVLRDGASAQYGSDAVAGVINIELEDSTGKTSVNYYTGQRYEGDGEAIAIGINHGISLNKKGFLDLSADIRYRNPTDRSGLYTGTVYNKIDTTQPQYIQQRQRDLDNQLIALNGFDRKSVAKIGTSDILNTGVLINGGYNISKRTDLYWTGSINYRHVKKLYASYRYPKQRSKVNDSLFRDGFLAYGSPTLLDISGIAGIEGKTNSDWKWDISSVYGSSSQRIDAHNTNNASQQFLLGKNAPTDFYTGTEIFRQNTNGINFSRDFASKIGSVKSLNFAMGSELRIENFEIREGEEASWENYDSTNTKEGMSQVFVGHDPSNTINATRQVLGFYTETEMEKKQFLIDIAGRYEYYSDYGANLAGKLAMRYKFSDKFSLRGAISNGFRAPSMQQIWFSSINTFAFSNSEPKLTATLRNNDPIICALEIPALKPEKSVNLSAGITSKLSTHISFTVDAYSIRVKDRIVLTSPFDTSIAAVNSILAGTPYQAVLCFTNAINTQTRGIDIVWNGNWNIGKGRLYATLSANFNSTQLFGKIQTSDKLGDDPKAAKAVINREEKGKIEWGQPHARIIFMAEYTIGKIGFLINNVYFGKTAHLDSATIAPNDEFFSPKINTSCNIHYSPQPWVTIGIGARNLLDVYPDRIKHEKNTSEGIRIYDSVAPQFGFDGGYYYLNMSFNF